MHLGAIFFLIGIVCLVLNVWYMLNSKDFSRADSEAKQVIGIGAVLLAPFITLIFLLITMNSLVVKGRR